MKKILTYINVTLQEKNVYAQLFDLEKHFKISYVYVKRKPMQFFSFQAFLSLTHMNALFYVDIEQEMKNEKTWHILI